MANMPSGRDIHSSKPYMPPALDAETLAQMRAPLDRFEDSGAEGPSSSDEERDKQQDTLPGAFPKSSEQASGESYY